MANSSLIIYGIIIFPPTLFVASIKDFFISSWKITFYSDMSLISGIQFIIHWKGFLFTFTRYLFFSSSYITQHTCIEPRNENKNEIFYRDVILFLYCIYIRIKNFFPVNLRLVKFLRERYVKRDMFRLQTRWLLNVGKHKRVESCCFSTNSTQIQTSAQSIFVLENLRSRKFLQKGYFSFCVHFTPWMRFFSPLTTLIILSRCHWIFLQSIFIALYAMMWS
jgi:hypothetical protein